MIAAPFYQPAIVAETADPGGPFGARGIGEPPLIGTPPAILSAIHDAIGNPDCILPATAERIRQCMAEVKSPKAGARTLQN